jgi:ribosomal protein L37AE/L43A
MRKTQTYVVKVIYVMNPPIRYHLMMETRILAEGKGRENSYCPACGAELIKRIGFRIMENRLSNEKCNECGETIEGVWA